MPYARSAAFYDAIYSFKDYAREAQLVRDVIEEHRRSDGRALLDVACGTGLHLFYLQDWFDVQGLDLEPGLLAAAADRLPGVRLVAADMLAFDLGAQFDAVTCLFSAIGYVRSEARLRQAVACMARHLKPGGVLIIEPWFAPDDWHPGTVHANYVDDPGLKIARMTVSEMISEDGAIFSRNDMHYLVATPAGIDYFTERHELGLFTHQAYLDALRASDMDVIHDPDGLTGRGLYIGRRALQKN